MRALRSPKKQTSPVKASLVTVSFRGDLSLAKELCASIDRFVDVGIEHVLIVPSSDAGLFAPLVTKRRRVATVEDVLPSSYRRVMPSFKLKLGPFSRRFREMWLTPAGLIRGW